MSYPPPPHIYIRVQTHTHRLLNRYGLALTYFSKNLAGDLGNMGQSWRWYFPTYTQIRFDCVLSRVQYKFMNIGESNKQVEGFHIQQTRLCSET